MDTILVIECLLFQAEDGIRDRLVTGVQTCALPISIGLYGMTFKLHPIGLRYWHNSIACSGASFTPGIRTYSAKTPPQSWRGYNMIVSRNSSMETERARGMICFRISSFGALIETASESQIGRAHV